MVDPTYRSQLITNFRGAALELDQPDVIREAAILAQNVEYYVGVVRTRLGFTQVLATIQEAVTSMYNWVSTLGNYLVRYRSSDRSMRITNIATGVDAQAIAGDLLGYGATYADSGTRLYCALFLAATQRGATAARSISYQSAAFVSDKLFQGPITYAPAAPTEPGVGSITAGLHFIAYRIEYRNGFITRPSPDTGSGTPSINTFAPVSFTATGAKNATWTLTTTWPAGAVKIHIIMSPVSNPALFFFVPGATANVTGGSLGTVAITFDIGDDDLYNSEPATESLLLLTNSTTDVEQIQPYLLLNHGDRMVYLTQVTDPLGNFVDTVYISEKGKHQEITADEHLVEIPGQRQINTAISMDGVLYLFGPHWTYRTIDNGDKPNTWPAPMLVDGGRGTLAIRGAEVAPSGTYAWVADQSGLYYFPGSYADKPLSYYQLTDWLRINWDQGHLIHIKDDATNRRVNVFVPLDAGSTTITHWMSWDYSRGFEPEKVNYTLNDIKNYTIGAAEFVENTTAGASITAKKHKELWVAAGTATPMLRQATKADAAPYRDNDVGIASLYQSMLFPSKGAPGQVYCHHGANYRVKGLGSLIIRTKDLDRKVTRDLAPITLELAPGKEYFRASKMISEGMLHEFNSNLLHMPGFETSSPTG